MSHSRSRNTWWKAAAVLVVALGALSGCVTNPATGRSQFNVIGREQEIRLGAEAEPSFLESYGGEIPDTQIVAYVRNIGMQLAELSERPDLPWEFHAVDSAVINAFALPGGKIFITRGLMEQMTSEAQLAGVLGHEVGHVTAKHINDQMTQQIAISVVLIGLGVVAEQQDEDWLRVLGAGAQVGGSLYMLKFSRSHEYEADELGLRYMGRLGYNPAAQAEVMEILQAAGGGGGGIELFKTHPDPDKRAERVRKLVAERYANTQNNADFVTRQSEYKRKVLDRLAKLPPPKHTGQ
jgi:predicted Zn-dependent protease